MPHSHRLMPADVPAVVDGVRAQIARLGADSRCSLLAVLLDDLADDLAARPGLRAALYPPVAAACGDALVRVQSLLRPDPFHRGAASCGELGDTR